jgi:hypothetical protein
MNSLIIAAIPSEDALAHFATTNDPLNNRKRPANRVVTPVNSCRRKSSAADTDDGA